MTQGQYSLTWIKLSDKSAQDQIKKNGLGDLWLKSVFTMEGSAELKKSEKSHIATHKLVTVLC